MSINRFGFLRVYLPLFLGITIVALLCVSETQLAGTGHKTLTKDTSQSGLITVQPRARLTGHKQPAHALAFSPDGRILATGSEKTGALLWDVSTEQLKAALPGHDATRLSFSRDGRTIQTSRYGYTVRLWDVKTAKLKATLVMKKGLISSVAFSPDGRAVATASLDESIVRLWDVETGTLEATLAHEKECDYCSTVVWSVAFSPDGRTIATAPSSRKAYLWDAETKKLRMTLVDSRLSRTVSVRVHAHWVDKIETASHESKVYVVAFSPDGRTLATGSADGTAKLWDMPTGELKLTLKPAEKAYPMEFSSDSKLLATSGGSTVRLWNVKTGELRAKLPHKGMAWSSLSARTESSSLPGATMKNLRSFGTQRLEDS